MQLHPCLAEQLAQARRLDFERMSARRRLADGARRARRSTRAVDVVARQLLPALAKSRIATPSITAA